MGRYSWTILQGKENHKITLISAYQVCHMITQGPFTAYLQQCHILALCGNQNPDPREEITNDLIQFINDLKTSGHQIILSIDTNEEIKDSHKKLWNSKTIKTNTTNQHIQNLII